MEKEIMIRIGLSNLLVMFGICMVPFIASAIANVIFLYKGSKRIDACRRIIQEPNRAIEIATEMIPGAKRNDRA